MRIEYAVELPCEPRRRFGEDGLRHRLRCLQQGRSALPGDPRAAAARQATFELRPLAFHCTRCPANFLDHEFGCSGSIAVPLSPEAEEWLIGRLPSRLNGRGKPTPAEASRIEATRRLLEWLTEAGIDGLLVDTAYRKARSLVERRRPAERRYGPLFRRTRLTSSQLLHLLFLRERVHPPVAETVCRALGIWEDGGPGADGIPEVVFTEPVQEEDDESVADLKEFLFALMIACSLDVPLRTELVEEGAPPSP